MGVVGQVARTVGGGHFVKLWHLSERADTGRVQSFVNVETHCQDSVKVLFAIAKDSLCRSSGTCFVRSEGVW